MRELEQRIESREVAEMVGKKKQNQIDTCLNRADRYWDRVFEMGGYEKHELTVTSLEVAKMVTGKEHSKLLRDIKRYSNQLAEANIGLSEFFRESTYKDSTGRTLPCYEITKKGCEFIAHKLTGTKGTAFTAKYINRFHEMESKLLSQAPATLSENDMEILAEKVAERLIDRSRKTTEAENRHIYSEYGSSQYEVAEEYTIEIRKQELYSITMKTAELFREDHSSILHQMYKALEKKLGIVLDAYKSVYRTETGKSEASMVEVIAANDKIYDAAIDLNRYVIGKKTIYQ